MEIVKAASGDTITLAVIGKLNAATADELGSAVDLALGETKSLVLDFKGLTYIASTGLRILVSAQKKLKASGGTLRITHVGEEVMEVFEITGMNDIFDIQ
ncbi:MAG: STAS domain-containing protein [Spirochaetaceae bacterium]|jgi:anti-sigma B factor antagonist|nr:STAS domain-containing protein [Spirochaetaceae bacterium]